MSKFWGRSTIGTIGRRALPEPARERARLLLARRLEARQRRGGDARGAALVFHAVAEAHGDDRFEIDPPIAADRLDEIVAYLSTRYALVHAGDLLAVTRSRRPGERLPIAITFDDDLPSHAELAKPVFERHNANGTVFLCGTASPFWWQLLQIAVDRHQIEENSLAPVAPDLVRDALRRQPRAIKRLAKAIEDLQPAERDHIAGVLRIAASPPPRILTPDCVAALSAAGWEIGFHTDRHDLLTRLSDDELRAAIRRRPVPPLHSLPRTLAYPHGKATSREAAAAGHAGYIAAYTGRPEVITDETDDHLIGRLQPDPTTVGRFALDLARALAVST